MLKGWELLVARSTERGAPASPDQLEEFEACAGFPLHPSVRSAWELANGLRVPPRTKILNLTEAMTRLDNLPGRLFPVTDYESNPTNEAHLPECIGQCLGHRDDASASALR